MESRNRRWVLALTSIASLMVALDTLVVSTALTTIREDLAASVEELEWTVNAFNLSLSVLLLQPLRWGTASAAGACSPPSCAVHGSLSGLRARA